MYQKEAFGSKMWEKDEKKIKIVPYSKVILSLHKYYFCNIKNSYYITDLNSQVFNFIQNNKVPFVERDGLYNELSESMTTQAISDGRRILLFGENGIGKTRLVEEVISSYLHSGIEFYKLSFDSYSGPYLAGFDNKFIVRLNDEVIEKIKHYFRANLVVLLIEDYHNYANSVTAKFLDKLLTNLSGDSVTIIVTSRHLTHSQLGFFELHQFEIKEILPFSINEIQTLCCKLFVNEFDNKFYEILLNHTFGNISILNSVLRYFLSKKIISYFNAEKIFVITCTNTDFEKEVKNEVTKLISGRLTKLNERELSYISKVAKLGKVFSKDAALLLEENSEDMLKSIASENYLYEVSGAKMIYEAEEKSVVFSFTSAYIHNYLSLLGSIRPNLLAEIVVMQLPIYSYNIFQELGKHNQLGADFYRSIFIPLAEQCSRILHDQFLPYYKQSLLKISVEEAHSMVNVYKKIISETEGTLTPEEINKFECDILSHETLLLPVNVITERQNNIDKIFLKTENCSNAKLATARIYAINECFVIDYYPRERAELLDEIFELCKTYRLLNNTSFIKAIRMATLASLRGGELSILNFRLYVEAKLNDPAFAENEKKEFLSIYKKVGVQAYITESCKSAIEINEKKELIKSVISEFKISEDANSIMAFVTFYMNIADFRAMHATVNEIAISKNRPDINSMRYMKALHLSIAEAGLIGDEFFDTYLHKLHEKYLPDNLTLQNFPDLTNSASYNFHYLCGALAKCDEVLNSVSHSESFSQFLFHGLRLGVQLKQEKDKFYSELPAKIVAAEIEWEKLLLQLHLAINKKELVKVKKLTHEIFAQEVLSIEELSTLRCVLELLRLNRIDIESVNLAAHKMIIRTLNWLEENMLCGFIPPLIEELKIYGTDKEVQERAKRCRVIILKNIDWLKNQIKNKEQKVRIKILGQVSIFDTEGNRFNYRGKMARMICLMALTQIQDRKMSREEFGNILNESKELDREALRDTLKKYIKRIKMKIGANIFDAGNNFPQFELSSTEIDANVALNKAKLAVEDTDKGYLVRALANMESCFNHWHEGHLFQELEEDVFDSIRAYFEVTVFNSLLKVVEKLRANNPKQCIALLEKAMKIFPENDEIPEIREQTLLEIKNINLIDSILQVAA